LIEEAVVSSQLLHRSPPRDVDVADHSVRLRIVAAVVAAVMSLLYLAIFAGVLSVGRAETGELGILGVAGALFAVLAVLLWRLRSRPLWAGVAALQVLLFVMYVAIAPERDPSYEVWGVLIRVLSVVLLGAVGTLFARSRTR
jgi:hypothetical protein